jgi:hypothetical protein
MLALAIELGVRIKITLISRPSCNYCGGLITALSLQTMRDIYDYQPGPDVVLSEIDEAVLINPRGAAATPFESPLVSVFRTGRFGPTGLDSDFRETILAGLPERAGKMLSVVEPAVATSVELPSGSRPGVVTYSHSGGVESISADLIVFATGLRSLKSKLMAGLCEQTGYRPPGVMPASVTEIDLTEGGGENLRRRMLVVNGIIRGSVLAIIPKQVNWITIAALNKVLDLDDLNRVFAHPVVRQYVQVDNVELRLACNKVCASEVYTSAARNFYGDGWVLIGDLSGYGRVLKDGYFAGLLGAHLAAHAVVQQGCSRESFARYYHGPLRQFEADNRAGMTLFALNNRLAGSGAFNRALVETLAYETSGHPYGGLTHAAFRALSTGELPYRLVGLLLASGLMKWAVTHPIRALSCASS